MSKMIEITDRLGSVYLINLSTVAYIMCTSPEPNPAITIYFAFSTSSIEMECEETEADLTAHQLKIDIDYHDFKRQLREQSAL